MEKRVRPVPAALIVAFLAAAVFGLVACAGEPPLPKAKEAAEADAAAPAPDRSNDLLPPQALARLGSARLSHAAEVYFLGFAGDSKHLVTASGAGTFCVWDVESGKEVRRLEVSAEKRGHLEPFFQRHADAKSAFLFMSQMCLALSADGRLFAAADHGGWLTLWSVATGKTVRSFQVSDRGNICGLAFAPDGKRLASKDWDQVIRLWDVETGKEVRRFGEVPVTRNKFGGGQPPSFSPDGKLLASLSKESPTAEMQRAIKIWEVETGKELPQIVAPPSPYAGSDGSAVWLTDSKHLVWFTRAKGIGVFDVGTGKLERSITKPYTPQSYVVSPTGATLAVWGITDATLTNRLLLYDLGSGRQLQVLDEMEPFAETWRHGPERRSSGPVMAFSPDGKVLARRSLHTVRFWDVASGKELWPRSGHLAEVLALALAPDGRTVLSWGADNTIRRWEPSGRELSQVRLPSYARPLALSANTQTVAFFHQTAAAPTIRVWDAATGKEAHKIAVPPREPPLGNVPVQLLALSGDGKRLAAVRNDSTLHLWELASGKEVSLAPLAPQGDPVNPQPNGAVRLSGGLGTALGFFADDRTLVSANYEGFQPESSVVVRLWDPVNEKRSRRFVVPGKLVAAALAPDGWTLGTAHQDGTVVIWELSSGTKRLQISGGPAKAGARLAFAPGGRFLAAWDKDGPLRVWDALTGKLHQQWQPSAPIQALTFAAGGRTLVLGGSDTAALVYSLAAAENPVEASAALDAKQSDMLWANLAPGDGARDLQAMHMLVCRPKSAVPLLRERLKLLPPVDPRRIAQLIDDLESNQFAARRKAEEELEKLGTEAAPALKRVLESGPGLDKRKRVERLLDRLIAGTPSTEYLRGLRAIEILEMIGSADAEQALAVLADRAADDLVGRAAGATRQRLAARHRHADSR
jgi:WD40 repeat protein